VSGLLICLAWAGLVTAAPGNLPSKGAADSPAEKLRKTLDQTISVEFVDQPLHLALAQLREQTKINFVLDRMTINQMGIDPETFAVQGRVKDVKVRTVLRSVLGGSNLGYAIVGETVFVSTDEMTMYKQMQQRVNVDLEKVEFAAALKKLGRETATNLIVDTRVAKEASQPVSLQMEDVPLETVVRLMAEMVGLKPVRVGNVLFVCSKASAQELRADPDLVQPHPQPNPNGNPGIMIQPGVIRPAPAAGVPAAPPVVEKVEAETPPPPEKPKEEKKN
jgi:hypothetical protein